MQRAFRSELFEARHERSDSIVQRQQVVAAEQALRILRSADELAQEVGQELGRSEVLLGGLSRTRRHGILSSAQLFRPTLAEAQRRMEAVRPGDYERTRSSLDGEVSELSPYITHGFIDLVDVATEVSSRHPLGSQSRFMSELGWREFFRHVWWHRGDLIFESMHPGPLSEDAYSRELPVDIREARTGVPVIDTAVRMLYATGYLHNHARLWLASYIVHLRRVHWRVGADWLYAHLLDGDLASNHLSWQWVAGTFSQKPYLFNADNVARFAPERWRSRGSVVDASYEELEAIARGASLPPGQSLLEGVAEPLLRSAPPVDVDVQPVSRDAVVDRDIWLVHPWALRDPPGSLPADVLYVSIFTKEFHERWAWSEARWAFVSARMRELSTLCWHDSAAAITTALRRARSVRSVDDPHLDIGIRVSTVMNKPRDLFAKVPKYRPSFSQWWKETTRQI